MHRISILALMLLPLLPVTASAQVNPPSVPVIHFSFYAPPQEDAPVHIAGFEHSQGEIRFVLSNATDKPVVSVFIERVLVAPRGCAPEPNSVRLTTSGLRSLLLIPARGKAVLLEKAYDPHYLEHAIYGEKDIGAAYIQSQFGVAGVWFEDGTTWPPHINRRPRSDPFDSKLVDSEAGKCTDTEATRRALASVQEVVFGPESPSIPSKAPPSRPTTS